MYVLRINDIKLCIYINWEYNTMYFSHLLIFQNYNYYTIIYFFNFLTIVKYMKIFYWKIKQKLMNEQ